MPDKSTLTAEELKRKLDSGLVEFMLDLRNEDEFGAWRIDGRKDFPILNIPQEDFIGEEERHLSRFPSDKEIIVTCAHGSAAEYTVDILNAHGLRAASLKGGMEAWSEYYELRQVSGDPALYQFYRVARGCISYLIASGGMAVVIDAARHVDRILDLASTLNVKISRVIDTHLHADHISGGRELAKMTGAPYRIHSADVAGGAVTHEPLRNAESLSWGACTIDVIHSPGHTPGSTSLLLNRNYLFTGDTIMKTSLGRPDLGGQVDAWSALLYDTLFTRFRDIDDAVIVLPSHASSIREQDDRGIVMTTMGTAREERELFHIHDRAAFAKRVKESMLENPERYQEIRMMNLGVAAFDEAKQKELEIGKNLCGMARTS